MGNPNYSDVRPSAQKGKGKDNPPKRGKVPSDSLSYKSYCKPGDKINMPKNIGGGIKNKSEALDVLD